MGILRSTVAVQPGAVGDIIAPDSPQGKRHAGALTVNDPQGKMLLAEMVFTL